MKWQTSRPLRILDFDTESRPLSYLGQDFSTHQITAIAWKWIGEKGRIETRLLEAGRESSELLMIGDFLKAYREADLVTAHNLIRHDLPRLNSILIEFGMQPLEPKRVQDTYHHLKKRAPGFASQAALADFLEVKAKKVRMGIRWREANRLTPRGLEATRQRVEADVRQHIAVRERLLLLGWLRPPVVWAP